MPEGGSKNKSLDIFGIKPIGEAVLKVTDASLNAAGAFLGRICLPAAEEFGLLLKDKVGHWRSVNAAKIALVAELNLKEQNTINPQAHPRLIAEIIDKGSWSDDDEILRKWGGLLASSCDAEGKDDGNIIFITLLNQLTSAQVKILNYGCKNSTKYITKMDLPQAEELIVGADKLVMITDVNDIHRLDRELDHLRMLGLLTELSGGFNPNSLEANIAPTALAMHLYAKGEGFSGSPVDYWGLKYKGANG